VRYFFPLQLLILHFKKNHFLLFFWALLFGFTTGVIAGRFGVPQQFLVPEYRGGTGLISFAIVGFALGGFVTAFNLYTYIMNGYRFPFIATLSRPFHKFSLNNFLIPALFIVTYCWFSARFQVEKEFIPPYKVAMNLLSFIAGVTLFQGVSYFYFWYTNKDARAFGTSKKFDAHNLRVSPVDAPFQASSKWYRRGRDAGKWNVEFYLSSFRRMARARESDHYEKAVLEQVFSQNHINAARFEIALIVSFLLIGSLRENEYFVIPAAASSILFFTMLLMLISALHSWIKGWTLTLFVFLLVLLNFFYADLKLFKLESRGYGMDYHVPRAKYDFSSIRPHEDTVKKDVEHAREMLGNWRRRLGSRSSKPKLVIIDCSGGGSRSAYWAMKSLIAADSMCNGELMKSTVLITGASGGMVGAAYLRELYLRKALGEDINPSDPEYAERMGRDLLNPVILSTAVNDWFIRYQVIRDGEYVYKKDRGWAFEKQLSTNTQGLFDKRMSDYTQVEYDALTPMMVLSPTIVNDGRRLIMASQPVSYLAYDPTSKDDPFSLQEDVEFEQLFKQQRASNLRFLSALRMNATFPYAFPITTLPSEPEIGVMDAGIRDNFGLRTTYRFLIAMREWINANTSGVVIVQVRDLPKGIILQDKTESMFGRFMAPMGSIYGNMTRTQDYINQQMLGYIIPSFESPIELINLQLHQDAETHISLSWHLTKSEKLYISNALKDPFYKKEVQRLNGLLLSGSTPR